MRPAGPMSNGAITTVPPASATAVAVASASWTLTYVFHAGSQSCSGWVPRPATVSPCSLAMWYGGASPPGETFSNSHPRRPP